MPIRRRRPGDDGEPLARASDYVRCGALRLVRPYAFDFNCNVKVRPPTQPAHRAVPLALTIRWPSWRLSPPSGAPALGQAGAPLAPRARAASRADATRRRAAQARWAGKTLLDIFANEFPHRGRAYYEAAIADGRLTANGEERSDAARVMTGGDWATHVIHRHEPPVLWTGGPPGSGAHDYASVGASEGGSAGEQLPLAEALGLSVVDADAPHAVEIVAETDNLVVVCKPASLPVHPCGQYRKNSVLALLEAERGEAYARLAPLHRLDRLVSGVLLLSRDPKTSNAMRQAIEGGRVRKTYLARVRGVFPEGEVHVDAAISHDATTQTSAITGGEARAWGAGAREGGGGDGGSGGVLLVAREGPRGTGAISSMTKEDRKAAQRGERADVIKDAYTVFVRVATDGEHSIVECRPRTGRTHQLRVHLQFVGHPIVADPLYDSWEGGGGGGGEATQRQASKRARVGDIPAARALRLPPEEVVATCPHCPGLPPHDFEIDVVRARARAPGARQPRRRRARTHARARCARVSAA